MDNVQEVSMKFINRKNELNDLDKWAKPGSMIVVYGRRRVGKTYLISHWFKKKSGIYSQAIEGSRQLQIDQAMGDLAGSLNTELRPTNWSQFFEIIERTKEDLIICLDEFPYLVDSDASLPSILQKWWDHKKKKNITLFLCGSSQKMMHSIFLNESAALFGRAQRILKIEPMEYKAFCEACNLKFEDQNSYLKYSLVGGVPRYWEYVDHKTSIIELAEMLYFQSGALLEREPHRILSDEKVEGIVPLSVLEAIGRGAHRSSEISGRLEAKQSTLSKIFSQLINVSLIFRETPFGISPKDSKKSLYKLKDPVLAFWYSVYSVHRSRWPKYTELQKQKLIYDHASHIFESDVRDQLNGMRYWDGKVELDIVSEVNEKSIQIVEVKFAKLKEKEKSQLLIDLQKKVESFGLFKSPKKIIYKIFAWDDYI